MQAHKYTLKKRVPIYSGSMQGCTTHGYSLFHNTTTCSKMAVFS